MSQLEVGEKSSKCWKIFLTVRGVNFFGVRKRFMVFTDLNLLTSYQKISSSTQIVWESHGGVLDKYRSFKDFHKFNFEHQL